MAVITALSLTIMFSLGALTVDIGLAYLRHTQTQAAADMAVLTAGWLLPTGNLTAVKSSADTAFTANGSGGSVAANSPTIGVYTPNPNVSPGSRYAAGQNWSCQAVSNADQIQAAATSPVELGRAITQLTSLTSTVLATATRNVDAAFTVGSGLVSVSQTSTMNSVLGSLLGANISLQAVDYSNLLNANVNGLAFINALATQLGITAGTYNSLLSSSASVSQIINAELAVLATQGSVATAAISSLETLKNEAALSGSPTFQVGQLLALGAWGSESIGATAPPSAVFGALNVYSLVTFAAQAATGANALAINQTGVSIPGVATMSLGLTAIEPPQPSYYDFSSPCMTVHTAQIRTQLNFQLLSLLTIPGIGITSAPVSVPLYIEIASGAGTLTNVGCPTNASGSTTVTIDVHSYAGTFTIGTVPASVMNNFKQEPTPSPATLVNFGVLTITGSSQVQILPADNTVTFVLPSPNLQTSQSQMVSSAAANTAIGTELINGLTQNQGAALTISLVGVALPVGSLTQSIILNALTPVLNTLSPAINPTLQALFGALGLSVGNVTIFVSGARCGSPVLVQ